MLSTFLSSLRSQNLSIYSSPSHQSVRTLPRSIKLPDFFGAVPEATNDFRVNELCRDVADETEQWLLELLNDVRDRSREGKSEDCKEAISILSEKLKPSLLAACLFPGAGRTQLRICSDLVTCLLILERSSANYRAFPVRDDTGPGGSGGHLATMQISKAEEHQLCLQGLANVTSNLGKNARFAHVSERLEASIQSLSNLSRTMGSTQEAVIANRYHKPWFSIPIGIMEYALDMEINDSTVRQLGKAPLADMREAAEDILNHAHIVYSISGQFCHARRNQSSNAPSSHIVQPSIPMQKVWDECEKEYEVSSQRCLQRIRDFVALQAKILRSSPEAGTGGDSFIEQYVKALGHYVRGFLQWSFETELYFGDEGERIRVTLKVPIDEDEEPSTHWQVEGEEQ